MFKPTTLRVYLLRAREAGFDPDSLLQGSGVSWDQVDALETFELDTIATLFGSLARRTPPAFAMQCGYACSIRDFGIVGFSMMSMPTLREAFTYWTRYSLLIGHPLVCTVSEEGDQWCMRFVPRRIMSEEALRFLAEVSIAALEPVIEELTDSPPNTLRVDFAFSKPASIDGRYDLFSTRDIQFSAQASAYIGRREDLDRPIRSRDGEVSNLCYRQSDRFLAELNRVRSVPERLEDIMMISGGDMPTLDDMAAALRMSRRSLQRELRAQDLSYQQVVRDFRIRHAKLLVGENRTNIKTIAYLLGFKDVSSFRRAFRSWTGQSIGQWKESRSQGVNAERVPGELINLHPSRPSPVRGKPSGRQVSAGSRGVSRDTSQPLSPGAELR